MNNLIILVGPTASGKTSLGIQLAQALAGAVVSADSRQVFAGLNIGTAKPAAAWRNDAHDALTTDTIDGIDHYLLNVCPPDQTYTLPQWQAAAYQVIDHLHTQHITPLLVGGTMLYADSIIFNYHIPAVGPNESLRQELSHETSASLYKKMIEQDPATAEFIEPHHQQRIIRALEVIAATGQPFSASRQKSPARYRIKTIGLFPGWEVLTKNITERAQAMLSDGLLDEVQQLRAQYGRDLPLLTTMNYQHAGELLDQKISAAEALQKIVSLNVRYARRQMSWWKNRNDITWFAQPDITAITTSIADAITP